MSSRESLFVLALGTLLGGNFGNRGSSLTLSRGNAPQIPSPIKLFRLCQYSSQFGHTAFFEVAHRRKKHKKPVR